ncbi:MAG: hypothetical protein JO032_21060 [Alphaproteobacteria bacterium]|nr:hypothetical protein [Alphaproteobacteria bacterium]
MRRGGFWLAAGLALVGLGSVASAQGYGPGGPPDWQRREHCERLRERMHELRDRIPYAPPWERDRMQGRLFDLRERLRAECWG